MPDRRRRVLTVQVGWLVLAGMVLVSVAVWWLVLWLVL